MAVEFASHLISTGGSMASRKSSRPIRVHELNGVRRNRNLAAVLLAVLVAACLSLHHGIPLCDARLLPASAADSKVAAILRSLLLQLPGSSVSPVESATSSISRKGQEQPQNFPSTAAISAIATAEASISDAGSDDDAVAVDATSSSGMAEKGSGTELEAQMVDLLVGSGSELLDDKSASGNFDGDDAEAVNVVGEDLRGTAVVKSLVAMRDMGSSGRTNDFEARFLKSKKNTDKKKKKKKKKRKDEKAKKQKKKLKKNKKDKKSGKDDKKDKKKKGDDKDKQEKDKQKEKEAKEQKKAAEKMAKAVKKCKKTKGCDVVCVKLGGSNCGGPTGESGLNQPPPSGVPIDTFPPFPPSLLDYPPPPSLSDPPPPSLLDYPPPPSLSDPPLPSESSDPPPPSLLNPPPLDGPDFFPQIPPEAPSGLPSGAPPEVPPDFPHVAPVPDAPSLPRAPAPQGAPESFVAVQVPLETTTGSAPQPAAAPSSVNNDAARDFVQGSPSLAIAP